MKLPNHRTLFSFLPNMAGRLALVSALGLSAGLLGACELTEGADGNMTFQDLTTGDVDLSHNLAVGATVKVRVSCVLCSTKTISSVTSSAPSVVSVVGDNGTELVLRAESSGSAEITVRMGDVSDRIMISTAEVAEASVRFEPWPDLATLPATLWPEGFALFPEGSVTVRAFPKDGNAQRTTGFGAITWEADGDAVVSIPEDRSSDSVVVTAPAETGAFVLSPSVGSPLNVGVVAMEDIASLSVYSADGEVYGEGDALRVEAGSALILHLGAYTAEGVYVAGNGGSYASATLTEGAELLLSDTLSGLGSGDDDPRDVFPRGYLLTSTGALGSGKVSLEWAGHSVNLDLEVVEASE